MHWTGELVRGGRLGLRLCSPPLEKVWFGLSGGNSKCLCLLHVSPSTCGTNDCILRSHDGARGAGNTREHVGALLRDRAGDGGALHLTLRVDNHTRVVLKVDEGSVLSPPRLALPDQHTRHDLLPEVRFTVLHGADAHVTRGGGRQLVKAALDARDCHDVQVLGACGTDTRHAARSARRTTRPFASAPESVSICCCARCAWAAQDLEHSENHYGGRIPLLTM